MWYARACGTCRERLCKSWANIKIEMIDGVKIWLDEETWVMVRPSGTEPLIRMYAESTDKDLLDSKAREFSNLIRNQISSN